MYTIIERYGAYLAKEITICKVNDLEKGMDRFVSFINEHGIKNNVPHCGQALDKNGEVVESYLIDKDTKKVTKVTE